MIRYVVRLMLLVGVLALSAVIVNAQQPHREYAPNGSLAQSATQPIRPVSDQSSIRLDLPSAVIESHEPKGMFDGPVAVENLIGYALANNPEIQAARYHAQSLGARIPQAKSLPDPQLMTAAFLEQIQTAAGPQQAAVSLSQKFPWFGKRALRSQVAYYESVAAYARVTAAELKVIEQVKRAYFDLYFIQCAVNENRLLQQPLEDVIAVAKTRYETSVGKTGLQDVLQAQVELSKLKIDLVKLEESQRKAQARMAGLLHLPPQTHPLALSTIPRSNLDQSVENLVGLAEVCQPEFEAFRRELARDQSAVEVARRNYWPDVTMGLNWYDIGNQGLSPVANGRDAFSLGVGINLPIYRSRLDGAVREAQNKRCETTRHYATVRDQFQTEIETLHAQFREHDRTLQILKTEVIPRADEALKLTIESYRAGRSDFEQLMDVYRVLLRYRIELHRQAALREQTIASLERAVGTAITSPLRPESDQAGEILPVPSPQR